MYLVLRHCAHFFLRVPSVCLGSNTEGSMVDTALELSDNSLQNCNYEVFCHLVLHRLARCRRWVGCCWWSCRPSPLLRVRGGGWLADWLAVLCRRRLSQVSSYFISPLFLLPSCILHFHFGRLEAVHWPPLWQRQWGFDVAKPRTMLALFSWFSI